MEVDLNADLGESYGAWTMGRDVDMLDIVTSANIACGFHAGDPEVMADTIALCRDRGVGAGAHPGFDDLHGFGRRRITGTSDAALRSMVIYQVGAFVGMATAAGVTPSHIKLHGAFNNMACEDRAMADVFAQAVADTWPDMAVFAVAGTQLEAACRAAGLPTKGEVFADRAYTDEAQLVRRGLPGAVIHDPNEAADNVLRMVEQGAVTSQSGKVIPVNVDTICVHGDNPQAVALAAAVRERLEGAGVKIRTPQI